MGSLNKEYTKEKLTGQIFTPFFIVDKILNDINFNSDRILGKTILDPACGDGRFLIKIVERIIKYSNINDLEKNLSFVHAWDIDKEAIEIAKENLNKLIAKFNFKIDWNIENINSLHINKKNKKFDFIVGNPPYIRIQHLELNERKFIQDNYKFCESGSTDIYYAFYELASKLLSKNGSCGFITPNTFFSTDAAKHLRNYFETNKNLKQISNYSHLQVFNNATTYSAIVIFDKNKNENFLFQQAKNLKTFEKRIIDFSELTKNKFWQLSVNKQVNQTGKRLGDIADIHVGITTLADSVYMMDFLEIEENYIVLESKIKGKVKFEKGILKPIIKVSKLKNGGEKISKYVLFPYKTINDKSEIIKEKELKNKYPLAYNYLLSVKDILDKRDNGKPNKITWYAYGRTQSLITSFGKKILFSPMNKKPNFILSENEDASFYSGYCIKYSGNYKTLLKQLNSKRMEEYIRVTARDFRGGWKSYNKKIVQEFIVNC